MKKDRLFQYAYDNGIHNSFMSFSDVKIIEDTDLITEDEAHELWDKYYPDVVKNLEKNQLPQMCIWKDAENSTDYHTVEKEVDYRDCIVKNGRIYNIKKTLIE